MRDWGKILLAVVENFLEKYLGKNALKELKQPALDEELKYKVAAAALRAEAHWAKHYSDSVIIEAIQTMPLHDLPSIQVAIMQMIEQPSSMTLPDNLKAQIRNILPNNFTDEQILPAVQSWLEVLKNELLGIDDFRKILQALAELETARNTSAVADDLHQLRLMVAELLQKRLEAPTLFDRLPNNDEGKEEFVRIMQLLLFHQARRQGKSSEFPILGGKLIINSDENYLIDFRDRSAFIYMFCASPISQKDRTRITEAITSACKNNGKEIILVTPGNLSELSSGRNISDKAWFDHLRSDLTNGIELSHWGHLKLLSMIKQTPALCLYYYPELMDSGTQKHTTIQDLTQRYITNLKAKYGNIEFVGMSVYKPEATRGVPMEAIYIPLSMVLTSGGNENSLGSHIDPLRQLKQGALTVILGDPGSGKSTLLRFLALAGKSSALQRKYKAKRDQRLPLLIVLRRYADELKQDHYLSIFDFILRSIKADFSLHGIDQDFLVYYLETGQAILLFDGLDELPNPDLKEIIRDRISSLAGTFPGNTIIVTSRIVGYDSQFRFDDRFFDHLQISKLSLTSIEQFVHDWYTVRIRDEAERNANIQDLIRIFRDKNHAAIRELAENPLLLTIIALVHRLDAVLPDERVVLYQKCTETLLNTWHAWKFRSVDTKEKDKQDRKNRRRLEVIAYWMHQRAGQVKANERSIIPYCELKEFLTDYITNIEKPSSLDYDAEDIADEFLRFINQRAGLLVEVGDRQYSFV
ncbi:MAG: NACHT domain-containing protein, partial [Anaerolineales bacterium]|nr:NACHT domain-containing protein [Anaerolineales bacterium]